MNPDQLVGLAVAFALGALVMDVAHEQRCAPQKQAEVRPPLELVCAHYQAIGQGWRCI